MTTATLPDALADALGRVVADAQHEWRKDVERLSADSRVLVSELRLQVFTLTAALKDAADQQAARVAEAIAAIKNGDPGDPGKNADPQVAAEIAAKMVSDELSGVIRADVAAIHAGIEEMGAGIDGKITEQVTAAVAALPVPMNGDPGEPGHSVDPEEVRSLVIAEVDTALQARPVPAAPTAEELAPLVDTAVSRAVAAAPKPRNGEDGKSLQPADVADMISAEVAKAVAALPAPEDGVGVTGAVIDRSGVLILTLSNGAVCELGSVVGPPVDLADVQRLVDQVADALPQPADGHTERIIADLVDKAVAKLPPPEPGRNADPEEIRAIIADLVEEAVSQLPPPEPGESITPADVADMITAEVSAAVAALPVPRDGESVAPAEVERMVTSEVVAAMERARAANDDCVPDELAETVSKAIRALAESPSPAIAAAMPPFVLNVAAGASERRPLRKTITTRRDEAGNLIAEVVEL